MALDNDPESIRVARANATQNAILGEIAIQQADLLRQAGRPMNQYDLVCANLIFDLLIAGSQVIAKSVKAEGNLVLAGILRGQFRRLEEHYRNEGFRLALSQVRREWHSGLFVRV
jgi:ribosomal protein L11 methyltransferase